MTHCFKLAAVFVLLSLIAFGQSSGKTRTYYVAADEVDWDYAPDGVNKMMGMNFDGYAATFMQSGPHSVGKVYRKAIYREYTDASFTQLKPRAPEWEHLGILGPVLRAEVGDTIRVVFRNHATRPYSMHPHGVFYEKASEGTVYQDGSSASDKANSIVPPGETHTYNWEVTERAGPGPADGSSVVWLYHSHVNEQRDVASGLIGPIIITARGIAGPKGRPKDAGKVLAVQHNGGSVSVVLGPVQLNELVKEGNFAYDQPLDLNNAIAVVAPDYAGAVGSKALQEEIKKPAQTSQNVKPHSYHRAVSYYVVSDQGTWTPMRTVVSGSVGLHSAVYHPESPSVKRAVFQAQIPVPGTGSTAPGIGGTAAPIPVPLPKLKQLDFNNLQATPCALDCGGIGAKIYQEKMGSKSGSPSFFTSTNRTWFSALP